jgi:uncharacterized protein (TIGR02145 family)
MKKSILSIYLLLITVICYSQSPQRISYQAAIYNQSNQLVTNQQIGLRISILKTYTTGITVYSETHLTSTNSQGLISIEIGGGTIESGSFAEIDWSNGPFYVKTEADILGGSNYNIIGTSQLLSVPFALYSTKSEKTSDKRLDTLNLQLKEIENMLIDAGAYTVKDYDGNTYKTVKIGNQVWMAESLRTTHYNDGQIIPTTIGINDDIGGVWKPQFQWPAKGDENSVNEYGRLYTYNVIVDEKNICPKGFRIPTQNDLTELALYIGFDGGKLKAIGTEHWAGPNDCATNETGFNALPSGNRYLTNFNYGETLVFWTSTHNEYEPWLNYYNVYVGYLSNCGFGYNMTNSTETTACSIRCIKE